MATVKFNLRSTDPQKEQSIYLVFRHKNQKLVYSIGFKVNPKYWNNKNESVKNTFNVPNRHNINNLINDLRAEVKRFASQLLQTKDELTPQIVRQHLEIYTGKVKPDNHNLFSFIENFIERAETVVNINIGRKKSKRTIQDYRVTQNLLIDYDSTQKRKVNFETIDLDFYEDFILWLQKEGYALNTIGKHIKTLKTFLNAATEKGINKNLAFKSSKFKVPKEDSDNVYLSVEELTTIYKLDLTDNPGLDKARDLFMVGCCTGLRFSDFTNISPNDIKASTLTIEQKKTGGRVVIPMNVIVKEILSKYDNSLPKLSNAGLNTAIKDICELAEIKEPIKTRITKGGERITNVSPKYKLVSTHTARRSFATNAFKNGLSPILIMSITGHKTETSFMKYLKMTSEEHAQLILEHWRKAGDFMRIAK